MSLRYSLSFSSKPSICSHDGNKANYWGGISFFREVDGKVYEAYVREKEEAKQEYEQAVISGQAAAHVALR